MGKALRLAVLLTGLAAVTLVSFSLSWNLFVLPAYRDRGVQTFARLVNVVPSSLPRLRGDMLVVSHQPDPAGAKYRNWLRSPAASRLLQESKIGDPVPVIYLPGDQQGRAVLAADYDFSQQAPFNDPRFAAGALVLFGLTLGLSLTLRRRQRL